jgi:hypothetical protein
MKLSVWVPAFGHIPVGVVPTQIVIDPTNSRFAANSTTSYQITTSAGTWSGFLNLANPLLGYTCYFDNITTYAYEVSSHSRLSKIAQWIGPLRDEYGLLSNDAGACRTGLAQRWLLQPLTGVIREWSWEEDYIHAASLPATGGSIKGRMVFPEELNENALTLPSNLESHFTLPTECVDAQERAAAGLGFCDVYTFSKKRNEISEDNTVILTSSKAIVKVKLPSY